MKILIIDNPGSHRKQDCINSDSELEVMEILFLFAFHDYHCRICSCPVSFVFFYASHHLAFRGVLWQWSHCEIWILKNSHWLSLFTMTLNRLLVITLSVLRLPMSTHEELFQYMGFLSATAKLGRNLAKVKTFSLWADSCPSKYNSKSQYLLILKMAKLR